MVRSRSFKEFESCQHTEEETDPSSAPGSGSKFGGGGMGCTHSKVSNSEAPFGSETGPLISRRREAAALRSERAENELRIIMED